MTKTLFWFLLGPLVLSVGCGKKFTPDDLVVGDNTETDFFSNAVYLREADKKPVQWSSITVGVVGVERKHGECGFSDSAPREFKVFVGVFPLPLRVALGSEELVFDSKNVAQLAFTQQDWPSLYATVVPQNMGKSWSGTLRLPLRITLPGHPEVERAITLPGECLVYSFMVSMIQQPSNEFVAVSPEARAWLISDLLNSPYEAYQSMKGTKGQKPLRYSFQTDAQTLGDIRYVVRRTKVQFDGIRCRTHAKDVRKFKSTLEVYDRESGKLVAEEEFTTAKDKPCERETLCVRPEDFVGGTCYIPEKKDYADDPFDVKAESAWIEKQRLTTAP